MVVFPTLSVGTELYHVITDKELQTLSASIESPLQNRIISLTLIVALLTLSARTELHRITNTHTAE